VDLSLSETLDRIRKWERQATELNGMLLGDASLYVIKFKGRVAVHAEGFIMSGQNGFELTMPLLPAMTFHYDNTLLEIRALGWRCTLFEDKPDHGLRLVK